MWLGLWSALGIERGNRRDDLHEGLTEGGGPQTSGYHAQLFEHKHPCIKLEGFT